MAKATITLGFAETVQHAPDIFGQQITEHPNVPADVLYEQKQWKPGESVNDILELTHKFSVVLDDYLLANQAQLRYVCFAGTKWRVRTLTIHRPRVEISIGGLWHEETHA